MGGTDLEFNQKERKILSTLKTSSSIIAIPVLSFLNLDEQLLLKKNIQSVINNTNFRKTAKQLESEKRQKNR